MTDKERKARVARAKALREKGCSWPKIAYKLGVPMSTVWGWLNPQAIKVRSARYYAAHRDETKARRAKWKADNPGKDSARCAKWRAANPGRVKATNAKHNQERDATRERARRDKIILCLSTYFGD